MKAPCCSEFLERMEPPPGFWVHGAEPIVPGQPKIAAKSRIGVFSMNSNAS